MKIVTRQAWGARPPLHQQPMLAAEISELVFHYSASDADEQANHRNCGARVRGIQRYHMTPSPTDDTKPWADIAYSWVVCKHGYVFEGRGFSVRTAATGKANDWTLAVCFLGDDTKNRDDVTVTGRQALADVARMFMQRYPHAKRFSGHRDHMKTECPGDELYAFIHSRLFRQLAHLDDGARRAVLRKWIIAHRAAGWTWTQIKQSPNWKEFVRLGGR